MENVTIPYTTDYMFLGLAVIAAFTVGYIGTIWLRFRNTQKDMELVEQLSQEG